MAWAPTFFGKLIDAGEAESRAGRALLEERYRALQRQIPLLYLVALTNFVGLQLATGGQISSLYNPASLLVGLLCLRPLFLLRAPGRPPAPPKNPLPPAKTRVYPPLIN